MRAPATPVTSPTQAASRSTMPDPSKPSFDQKRTARSRSATVKLVWLKPTIIFLPSDHQIAAIDGQRDAVHEAGSRRCQEHDWPGHFVWLAKALHRAVPVQPFVR